VRSVPDLYHEIAMLERAALILTHLIVAQEAGDTASVDLPETGRGPGAIFSDALSTRLDVLSHPESMKSILSEVNIVWAGIFVFVGLLCVLQGYRWHKWLIVVLGGMAGVWAGTKYGAEIGSKHVAAACFGVLGAVLSWPMMRYSVALFGGLAGAFAGANIWTAVGQPAGDHRIGALVGLIVAGLMAFTAFRYVVVGLTTIGGATLLVFGAMAALMQMDTFRSSIVSGMSDHPLLVPVVTGSTALFGVIFQLSGGIKGMAQKADKADPKAKPAQMKQAA